MKGKYRFTTQNVEFGVLRIVFQEIKENTGWCGLFLAFGMHMTLFKGVSFLLVMSKTRMIYWKRRCCVKQSWYWPLPVICYLTSKGPRRWTLHWCACGLLVKVWLKWWDRLSDLRHSKLPNLSILLLLFKWLWQRYLLGHKMTDFSLSIIQCLSHDSKLVSNQMRRV